MEVMICNNVHNRQQVFSFYLLLNVFNLKTTFYVIEANWQYIIVCIVSTIKEEQTVNKYNYCRWVTEA